MRTRNALVILVATLAFGASACGSGSASSADLEAEVSSQLGAQLGQAPDSVDCPDDLPGEVGAEVRCTLTAGDETIGLTVTVTSVEDGTALFDIVVDDEPQS